MREYPAMPADAGGETKPWYGRPALWIVLGGLAFLWLLSSSCTSRGPARSRSRRVDQASSINEGFDSAIQQLYDIEEGSSDTKLQQIVERINQWLHISLPPGEWQIDPLMDTLPESMRNSRAIRSATSQVMLPDIDRAFLNEVALLRQASQARRGPENDPLAIATRLFDWTVRNVQLDRPLPNRPRLQVRPPLGAFFMGHGTLEERNWVFMSLARQQGLDVVLLALGDPDQPDPLRPWITALVHGGELYLFDGELGIPVPGPEGRGVATLSQAAANDALLRRLDLGENSRYPVEAADLERVTALIEASPGYVARRMSVIEERLAGDQKMVLSISPSALAQKLKACPQIAASRVWTFPYEPMFAGPTAANDESLNQLRAAYAQEAEIIGREGGLEQGRVLYLVGRLEGDEDAPWKPTASKLFQFSRYEGIDLQRAASKAVNDKLKSGAKIDPQQMMAREVWGRTKVREYATYWLGLTAFERGQYEAAEDYFWRRYLQEYPDGVWTDGARYNLARTYEAQGNLEKAIEYLEEDESPQSHGSLLRAHWMRERLAKEKPAAKTEP